MERSLSRRFASKTVAAALSGILCLAASSVQAQQATTDSTDRARLKEARALAGAVYAGLRGRSVPSGRPFGWSNDFFKGEGGNTYVPYTLTIERAKLPTTTAALYVLVTPHPPAAKKPASLPVVLESDEPQPPPAPEAAFEAISFVDLSADHGRGPYRISRTFSLPAGSYDVYVALSPSGEASAAQQVNSSAVMMIRQELSVPDLWTTGLSTSSVVVAERVEAVKTPLTAEQRDLEPYTLGTTRIVPARETDFRKSDELAVIFFVYNEGLTARRKPDVSIDYRFHRREGAGETYFSKTSPQHFNSQTLPAFDAAAGHQLVAGQAVSLQRFPEGTYRLEIQITDNTSGASLVRSVNFGVR